MSEHKINYKAFLPAGLGLIGTGLVFMVAVNIAMGISWVAISIAKTTKQK